MLSSTWKHLGEKMSSVLFVLEDIPSNYGSIGGIGDLAALLIRYKCKAKELSCDDIYISDYPTYSTPKLCENSYIDKINKMNWPITNNKRVCFKMSKTTLDYLGIKILSESVEKPDYTIYPYMSDYVEGAQEILMGSIGSFFYMDYHVRRYGKLECYNPPKENINKKYIVIQYRNTGLIKNNAERMDRKYFLSMYKNLKDLLGNSYEFWKIGEDLPPENQDLESLFDEIIPVDYNLDNLFPIIRNSSLLISQHSGINFVGLLFGVPTMEVFIRKHTHPKFSRSHWNNWFTTSGIRKDTMGIPDNSRLFDTYNDKLWGGWFSSQKPPPSKECLKAFLTRNGLIE
jgi:hypothetical protein